MILIGEPDSPILWNGCGNTDITNQPIRSMSNKLWIESHLEGSGHSFSFQVLVFMPVIKLALKKYWLKPRFSTELSKVILEVNF